VKIRTRAEALAAAREADAAAAGFRNRSREEKDWGNHDKASAAADQSARMAQAARDYRALANSL
jgi:hypothetical protein